MRRLLPLKKIFQPQTQAAIKPLAQKVFFAPTALRVRRRAAQRTLDIRMNYWLAGVLKALHQTKTYPDQIQKILLLDWMGSKLSLLKKLSIESSIDHFNGGREFVYHVVRNRNRIDLIRGNHYCWWSRWSCFSVLLSMPY